MCNLCHATEVLRQIHISLSLKRFIMAICTSLPSTPTSQQVQKEILVEKREELLTAGHVESGKVCTICAKPKQCKNTVGVSDHRPKC